MKWMPFVRGTVLSSQDIIKPMNTSKGEGAGSAPNGPWFRFPEFTCVNTRHSPQSLNVYCLTLLDCYSPSLFLIHRFPLFCLCSVTPDNVAYRIADKIHSYFPQSVLLMIDNRRVSPLADRLAYKIYVSGECFLVSKRSFTSSRSVTVT